jgi:hypothetical protein
MPDPMLPADGNLTLYPVLTAEAARWLHVHAFADGNRPVAFIGHLWGEPQGPQGEPPTPDLTRRLLGLTAAAQDEALLSRCVLATKRRQPGHEALMADSAASATAASSPT